MPQAAGGAPGGARPWKELCADARGDFPPRCRCPRCAGTVADLGEAASKASHLLPARPTPNQPRLAPRRERWRALQNLSLSLSFGHRTTTGIREYLRAKPTTCAQCLRRPLAGSTLSAFEQALRDAGIPGGRALSLMCVQWAASRCERGQRAPVAVAWKRVPPPSPAGACSFRETPGLEPCLPLTWRHDRQASLWTGRTAGLLRLRAARRERFLARSGLPIQIATVELMRSARRRSIAHMSDSARSMRAGNSCAQPGPACLWGRRLQQATGEPSRPQPWLPLTPTSILAGACNRPSTARDRRRFGRLRSSRERRVGTLRLRRPTWLIKTCGARALAISERVPHSVPNCLAGDRWCGP